MNRILKDQTSPIRYPGFATLILVWTLLAVVAFIRHLLLVEQP
jgi:hypothetical protein